MLTVQSIVKTSLIILLVLFGFGTLGATAGFTVAVIIAAITGILLTYTMYSALPKSGKSGLGIFKATKTMLKYGFPISLGSILTGFLTQFYSWIMAIFVTDNSAIGNYSVATNFVVLITFFAAPVTTMLLPAFSKLDYRKEGSALQNIFQYSVKYAALIVLPITTMVMSLAQPAINILFQDKYPLASLYLALLALVYFYSAFGNLSITNLINSQGDTKYNLYLAALTVAVGFPLSWILVSQFGIIGLIATSTVVSIPSLIWSIRFIKQRYGISIDWVSSTKILFSAIFTGIVTYFFVSWLPFNSIIQLILGTVEFIAIFLVLLGLSRTLSQNDLRNIRQMAIGLGPLKKIINLFLALLEKLTPKPKQPQK